MINYIIFYISIPNQSLSKNKTNPELSSRFVLFVYGAEGGTRTPMRLPSADFESAPSTIPALRQSTAIFLQYEYYHNPNFFASVLTKSIFVLLLLFPERFHNFFF